jgi:hypothetical protein
MAVKLGSTNISTIKLGSTDVSSAYLGTTQVFSVSGGGSSGGGSSTTYFTPADGLTSSGTGSASDPIIFSSDLAATNPIVTVGNAESGGYVLIEATVNSGSDGDDDQQLSVLHEDTSVGG